MSHNISFKRLSFLSITTRLGIAALLLATLGFLPPLLLAAPPITVDSSADTTSAGDNACTLREAIANANNDSDSSGGDCATGSGDDVIKFAFALRGETIALSGTELSISSNISINGLGARQLAVSGGNASRVFNITGGTVEITGLTIRDGRVSNANGGGISNAGALTLNNSIVVSNTIAAGGTTEGGGIYNTGAVTITNSAIISNTAMGSSGRGGGIASTDGLVNLINSTISGNTANAWGGGVLNAGSSIMNSLNSTIVSNTATNWRGGGIYVENTTKLENTIIANNNDTGGPRDCYYLLSAPVSQDYNLVENVGNCTFSAGNDITGQDPTLVSLAANGGDTPTHHLLPGSPAIDHIPAGSNDCGTAVSDDQRGYLRVGPCSSGALEYDGIGVTLSKAVDDDRPDPGQTLTYTIIVTLAESGGISITNALISDTLPGGINFAGPLTLAGAGGTTGDPPVLAGGLTITGGTSVTVTFPVTVSIGLAGGTVLTNTAAVSSAEVVTPVSGSRALTVNNVAPLAGDDTPSVLEDSDSSRLDVRSNDRDLNGDSFTITAVGSTDNGGSAGESSGLIDYAPAGDFNGSEVFTYTISDGSLAGTATVTVAVTPVNDAPSFSQGPDQWVLQSAGAQTITAWATSLSAGPADEAGQMLSFNLSSDNSPLFSVQPALDGTTGDLTYTPAPNLSGSATVTVTLQDNGGTAAGGVDASAPQTFTITVVPGDTSIPLDPATGGTLVYTNTQAGVSTTLQIPGGAVTGAMVLVYDELPASSRDPLAGFDFAGRIFTLEAYQATILQPGYLFNTPVTLTLTYDPGEVGYIDEATLALRYWNGSAWDAEGVTLVQRDTLNHRLTVVINHLSEFALLGQAPSLSIDKRVDGTGGGGTANLPLSGAVTYTIVLSNSGGATAHGVLMSDTLPSGVVFGNWIQQGSAGWPAPGNLVEWGPHNIEAGKAYTIQFSANITHANTFAEKTITNTANFTSGDAGSGSDSAIVAVAANTPPTISAIADQITYLGLPRVVTFTVSDLETPLDMLAFSGAASNPALITDTDIVFSGGGAERAVTITPTIGITGASAVTITVTDGGGLTDETVFQLTAVRYFIYLPLVIR